jgi:hypothetical protein
VKSDGKKRGNRERREGERGVVKEGKVGSNEG